MKYFTYFKSCILFPAPKITLALILAVAASVMQAAHVAAEVTEAIKVDETTQSIPIEPATSTSTTTKTEETVNAESTENNIQQQLQGTWIEIIPQSEDTEDSTEPPMTYTFNNESGLLIITEDSPYGQLSRQVEYKISGNQAPWIITLVIDDDDDKNPKRHLDIDKNILCISPIENLDEEISSVPVPVPCSQKTAIKFSYAQDTTLKKTD